MSSSPSATTLQSHKESRTLLVGMRATHHVSVPKKLVHAKRSRNCGRIESAMACFGKVKQHKGNIHILACDELHGKHKCKICNWGTLWVLDVAHRYIFPRMVSS